MMPLGMRCKAVLTPLMTRVWPALWPPWKRTTPCALSVSQSTSLPLPSSPHCVPTTTTLRPLVAFMSLSSRYLNCAHHPLPIAQHQRAVTMELIYFAFMPWQGAYHHLTALAQGGYRFAQACVVTPGGADGGLQGPSGHHRCQGLHIQAEAYGGAFAPK